MGSLGTPLAKNSIICNQSQYWQLHLMTRAGQLDSVSPIIWQFYLTHFHICIHLSKSSTVLDFHTNPQGALNLAVSPNIFSLIPFSLPTHPRHISTWFSHSAISQSPFRPISSVSLSYPSVHLTPRLPTLYLTYVVLQIVACLLLTSGFIFNSFNKQQKSILKNK